ncbi:MAG TPA: BamA/TamA family outer membrane protein [Chitinophagaceae bacterium]
MSKWLSWGFCGLFVLMSGNIDAQQKKFKRKSPASYTDSATFPGYDYYKAGSFKKWLLGANYRDEWVHSITVPVFNISKEKGGLVPEKLGGGLQTKSLRLEDKEGNDYVLRSIEKFPDNNIPEEFRNTFVKDALVDGISASYPYAALSIPPLAEAAGVPHATPRLVYVPDDPALGEYRSIFANTLCIFEEREPGGFEKNIGTDNLLEKLQDDNDKKVNQIAVLKARLLDMFIMDFDRHDDQWRWGTNDTNEHRTYFPVPRDRDQAFFINQGFIPNRVAKYFPKFQGFRAKAKNINTFNFNAIDFDRTFLNATTEKDWRLQTDTLLMQMTDSVIDYAMVQQPKDIYGYSAPQIAATLKERRKYLMDDAIKYYHFLAKQVMVTGSDKDEFFNVQVLDNNNVDVTVYNIGSDNDISRKLYHRTFLKDETKEILLYGLGAKDSFLVKGDSKTPIRIRMIGGSGKDIFDLKSHENKRRIFIYDSLAENNVVYGHDFRNRLSNVDTVNVYHRDNFVYNEFRPGLSFSFNSDEGVFAGVGFRHTVHGFRKIPYAFHQKFYIRKSFATSALIADYNLEAIDIMGKGDLLVNSSLNLPRNTINFFGFGNETVFEKLNNKSINFYRTKLKHIDLNVLLRYKVLPSFDISFGPSFNYFHLERQKNVGTISYFPSLNGLDSTTLYKEKTYVGPLLNLAYDTRRGDFFTTDGVYWQSGIRYNKGLAATATDFWQVNTDLSFYKSIIPNNRLMLAVRFGGGFNSDDYEFYQSQYLSGTENLRGYRKYRFAGDKVLYNNLELRFRIADFQTYLLPGAIGLIAFHDVGRVWFQKQSSAAWHNGYGGGIWLAPAKKFVVTGVFGHSKEGWLPYASFGFRF